MYPMLKYNTQQVLPMPRLVQTDGITPATTLASAMDNTSTGIRIRKNFGSWAPRAAAVVATTHSANGIYDVTMKAADVGTLGLLHIEFNNAGCAPFDRIYDVVTAEVYDTFVTGTDNLTTDATAAAQTAIRSGLALTTHVQEVEDKIDILDGLADAQAASMLLSRAKTDELSIIGGLVSVDTKKLAGTTVIGDGSPGNKWRK